MNVAQVRNYKKHSLPILLPCYRNSLKMLIVACYLRVIRFHHTVSNKPITVSYQNRNLQETITIPVTDRTRTYCLHSGKMFYKYATVSNI